MRKLFITLLTLVFGHIISDVYAQTAGTFITYHNNGRVKTITHHGIYNGCGVTVGIDSNFNSAGILIKTIAYDHSSKGGKGCHDIFTKSTVTLYYKNGRHKVEQFFSSCYECTPVATGTWRWYNKEGKIIRHENKGVSLK